MWRILIAVIWAFVLPCFGSTYFEMTLQHGSMYTPRDLQLQVKLTEKATLKSTYQFHVSVYLGEALIRKQILNVSKNEPTFYTLAFPYVSSKTHGRCRAALYMNNQFMEAVEFPLILWPPLEPYKEMLNEKVIWVFDVSGTLLHYFSDRKIDAVDATFQAARSFSMPDIVFIGQNLGPESMRIIMDSVSSTEKKPVVIFLKQNQLPQDGVIEIPNRENQPVNVQCDFDSPLLKGLTEFDVMGMVDASGYIRVKKQEAPDWSIESAVSEVTDDKKYVSAYLFTIHDNGQVTIYCQLPVTGSDDPRCGILFENLLHTAHKISDSKTN